MIGTRARTWGRRYCGRIAIVASLLLAGVALINASIDPMGVWRIWSVAGINAERVKRGAGGSRVAKSLELWLRPYETILAGTSRVEVGLDPASPSLAGRRAYNTGLSGTNMAEIERVARFVLKHNPPGDIVIGLDFLAFSARRGMSSDFDASGFSGAWMPLVLARSLVGAGALVDSVATIIDNLRGKKADTRADGAVVNELKFGSGHDDGTQVPERLRKQFLLNPGTYACYAYDPGRVDLLRDLLIDARRSGVGAHLYVSPMHVWQIEAVRGLGLLADFKRWRIDLAAMAAAVDRATPGAPPLELWDFGGYNPITTEDVPEPGAGHVMRGYWDASHFSMPIGDLVLGRLLRGEATPGFGVLLTRDNVGAENAALESGHAAFAADRPDEMAIVEGLIAETADERTRLCGALDVEVGVD